MVNEDEVWLITGAGRGMGVDIARAALTAGYRVAATARDAARVSAALGEHHGLLAVSMDVTDVHSVASAVESVLSRFGRIDVLVNNAGTFQAGPFEEVTDAQFRAQLDVNFFGALNVTRTVLPAMRGARSGHVITITSTAGVVGAAGGGAYAASKFALEGWMEALHGELEPFGIRTTTVEPGFFRTELLVEGSSTLWPELSLDDYADSTAQIQRFFRGMHRHQPGDPAKLAAHLVKIVQLDVPPERWAVGADAVDAIAAKGRALVEQANAHLDLSTGLDVTE
ncbi:MAG TPA: SDR family oxidoreductase [Amnibacterium sp.]|nr:SDR family oxidoreductase [Amnibacterium sp.]